VDARDGAAHRRRAQVLNGQPRHTMGNQGIGESPMRIALASLMCAALALPLSAATRAEVINMATITCKDLLEGKSEDIGAILMWLHGYYGGRSGDTTLDVEAFTKGSEKIGQYCGQNPTVTVMQAIERIFK
jgi:acid stress chaperone HdeB